MVMDTIVLIKDIIYYIISFIGIAVVLWAVLEATIKFLRVELVWRHDLKRFSYETRIIRERLGIHLIFSLDIFVGADIIKTVGAPTMESVIILLVIVSIRIALSYFLAKEIERNKEMMKELDERYRDNESNAK
ncbi:protein of unknown function DUF1622 [Desulfurispirillum indicum S5]|uniref:DUF1622 domain-containing protein n=2 Tax=Desulfurispirillum TaxID=393029 RepID=E6W5H6_DESIS|nr:DUF1622 domain-containing protein [Desulfurispirillum indicum]ADU64907.1 protein of unknown function DUF1622 [Desulfurispirillum indicum S5]